MVSRSRWGWRKCDGDLVQIDLLPSPLESAKGGEGDEVAEECKEGDGE